MKHVAATTAINLHKLKLVRVNCRGLIMTSRGKIKVFREAHWAEDNCQRLWELVESISEQGIA